MGFKNKQTLKTVAALLAGLVSAAAMPLLPTGALVTDPAGNFDDFGKTLQYSLCFYDGNMCGPEVEAHSRFAWRANCHVYDQYCPLEPMDESVDLMKRTGVNLSADFIKKYYDILNTGTKEGTVDVSGGFHDAGDHVKFGLPEAYAGTTVSWGYYEFPEAYAAVGETEHVETIIRHFCDYFMRCTFRDQNGDVICFCYQVGDGDVDHKYWQLPQNDTMPRTAWFATPDNPTTCNIMNTAACLAINYLNFKESDPDYANKCLDYSKALYKFGDTNEKVIADTEQGPKQYYTSSKWEDDYSFASCWLYLITGDQQYIKNMLPIYDYYAPPGYAYNWNDMWNGVGLLMARISEDYKSGKTYTEAQNPLGQCDLAIEYMLAAGKNPYEEIDFWGMCAKAYHGYMSGSPGEITPQGYWWLNTWGSCRYNTAVQFCMLVYDKYTDGVDYYDKSNTKKYTFTEWAKGQMEYILGDNDILYKEKGDGSHGPRNFIVGFDENSAQYPHHRAASGLTKCEDKDQQLYVLFGALCGGPDNADAHNDVTEEWTENEVTIDYNAACPGAAAGLFLFYKDQYPQTTAPFTPPVDDGGRGSSSGGGENDGPGGTWVEALGMDDLKADGAGVTKLSIMVKSTLAKAPENLTVRYYFNISELANLSNVQASIISDQVATEAAPAKSSVAQPVVWEKDSKVAYIELSWGDYNFANCGKKVQLTLGLYYGDKWDPTNDWSYQGLTMFENDSAFYGTGNEKRADNICVYDGGVLIGGIEPDGTVPSTDEPTVTTTEPKEDPDDGDLLGDVDCNGKVNVADAVLLAQYNAEIEGTVVSAQGLLNADCNGDGTYNSDDCTLILQHIAGMTNLHAKD